MCGYRGYYTDQAMIHFDNNRLHTESKENNRKRRKEVDRVPQQNDDNNGQTNNNNSNTLDDDADKTIDSNEQTGNDHHETNSSDHHEINSSDQPSILGSDTTADSDEDVIDDGQDDLHSHAPLKCECRLSLMILIAETHIRTPESPQYAHCDAPDLSQIHQDHFSNAKTISWTKRTVS